MSPRFNVNDHVLVPVSQLPEADDEPFALVGRIVRRQIDRSIVVDDGQGGTVQVASRLAHPSSLGVLVLRIGDLVTETTLLDPLAKSVLQFVRLLLPDQDVRGLELRTMPELEAHWRSYHSTTSHVILIGHGSESSIRFVDEGPVSGAAMAERLRSVAPETTPKRFVSLACLTGRAGFAKPFSESEICREIIAPFQSVHGANASQYCQALLTEHLLNGKEMRYAHSRVAKRVVGGGRFRRWCYGRIRGS
jgi:hypothetical protein